MQPPSANTTSPSSNPYASLYAAQQTAPAWSNPQQQASTHQESWQGAYTVPQGQPPATSAPWQQPGSYSYPPGYTPSYAPPASYLQQHQQQHPSAYVTQTATYPVTTQAPVSSAPTYDHVTTSQPQAASGAAYPPPDQPHAAHYHYPSTQQYAPATYPAAATPQDAAWASCSNSISSVPSTYAAPSTAPPPWTQQQPPPQPLPPNPWQAPPASSQPQQALPPAQHMPGQATHAYHQQPWSYPPTAAAASTPPPWAPTPLPYPTTSAAPTCYPSSVAATPAYASALPPPIPATTPSVPHPITAATPIPPPSTHPLPGPQAPTHPARTLKIKAPSTPAPAPNSNQPSVIVWDLDETLIVFNSLITGHYCRANPTVRRATAEALGQQWQDAILALLDTHFHYERLEPLDICHVGDILPTLPNRAASSAPTQPPAPVPQPPTTATTTTPLPSTTTPNDPQPKPYVRPHSEAEEQQQPAKRHRPTPPNTPAPEPTAPPTNPTPPASPTPPGATVPCHAAAANCACHAPAQQVPSSTGSLAAAPAPTAAPAAGVTSSGAAATNGAAPAVASVAAGASGQPTALAATGAATMQPGAPCRAEPPATEEELRQLLSEVVHLYEGAASTCSPATDPSPTSSSPQQAGAAPCAGQGSNGAVQGWAPDGVGQAGVNGSSNGSSSGGSANLANGVGVSGNGLGGSDGAAAAGLGRRLEAVVQLVAGAEHLRQATDGLTAGWLQRAGELLSQLTEAGQGQGGPPVTHVLVTTGQLVATLGKLLVFHLAGSFPAGAVYSASKESKAACFQRIRARYGPDCRYCVIGDGAEEDRAAAGLRWPFIRIVLPEDPTLLAPSVLNRPVDAFDSAGRRLTGLTAGDIMGVLGR